MKTCILILLAGGTGALARYFLSAWIQTFAGSGFPWGTITVNILGCLIFGLLWTLVEEKYMISPQLGLIVLTGFVGSFTTFSTMTFETFTLMRSSAWLTAAAYLISGQFLGIVAAFAGVKMGSIF